MPMEAEKLVSSYTFEIQSLLNLKIDISFVEIFLCSNQVLLLWLGSECPGRSKAFWRQSSPGECFLDLHTSWAVVAFSG